MVTIPNSLKNKANKKVLSFLRKYSVLLKKIDPALAASYRKEVLPIEGQWVKQLRLTLEQYARAQELDGWQDFIQLVLDLKFHDLYKQIEKAGLVCYKEETKIKAPKIPPQHNFFLLIDNVQLYNYKVANASTRGQMNEERQRLRESLNNLGVYVVMHSEILETETNQILITQTLANLRNVDHLSALTIERIHYEIKRKTRANKVKTPVPSNPSQEPGIKGSRFGCTSSHSPGLFISSKTTSSRGIEPHRGSDELREQSENERDFHWLLNNDPGMVFSVTYSKPRGESTAAIQIPEGQFDVRPQNTEPLQGQGNDVDGFEAIEDFSVQTPE